MKITSIWEKPRPTSLPDGTYAGAWLGREITVVHEGNGYICKTDDNMRSTVPVTVIIINGEATFTQD